MTGRGGLHVNPQHEHPATSCTEVILLSALSFLSLVSVAPTCLWLEGFSPETVVMLGSRAVPAFPGATNRRPQSGDWASFQARACSLPPEPRSSTF